VNFFFLLAEDARRIMAQLGFRTMNEMIGRADVLETSAAIQHWKADGLDLTAVLQPAQKPRPDVEVRCTIKQNHGLEFALDNQLIEMAMPALENGQPVKFELPIVNTNRTVGTILSHNLAKRWGESGLPDDSIYFTFRGSAGQSFGAFLAHGVTLELEGDANDYVGKGLSGGKLIIYPPRSSTFGAAENILVGNVVLYGATSGSAFFRGRAAERFCVRNSGAWAVIEGVGDHGCEYMTGGRAVILGPTGRNFAAGMSGGIAYVFDQDGDFHIRCNLGTVALERVESPTDVAELLEMISRHYEFTQSEVAAELLDRWPEVLEKFVKVMPTDYKRVLMDRQTHDEEVEAVIHEEVSK
jgi:glutamate synthase (NADPH/NADH) large chain